jgi:hypothetical protein
MICGHSECGCGFTSESLQISNVNGIVSIESNAFGVVTSSTRPGSPFIGQHIYETDTHRELVWDGTFWRIQSGTFPAFRATLLTTDPPVPVATLGSMVSIPLVHEVYDTDGFITVPSAAATIPAGLGGVYSIDGSLRWELDPDSYRINSLTIANNAGAANERATIRIGGMAMINTANTEFTWASDILLAAGATVTLQAGQATGSSLDVVAGHLSASMKIHRPDL